MAVSSITSNLTKMYQGMGKPLSDQKQSLKANTAFPFQSPSTALMINQSENSTKLMSNTQKLRNPASVLSNNVLEQRAQIDAQPIKRTTSALTIKKTMEDMLTSDNGLTVIDLEVGKNESLGNDMVLLTFNDGSMRQTQKALYEAAEQLGVFDTINSSTEFANWHLNEWATGVSYDIEYSNAHMTFDDAQRSHDQQLQLENPEIAKNRLEFVKLYAPENANAIVAAEINVSKFVTDPLTVRNVLPSVNKLNADMEFSSSFETTNIQSITETDYLLEKILSASVSAIKPSTELTRLFTEQ